MFSFLRQRNVTEGIRGLPGTTGKGLQTAASKPLPKCVAPGAKALDLGSGAALGRRGFMMHTTMSPPATSTRPDGLLTTPNAVKTLGDAPKTFLTAREIAPVGAAK